MNAQKTIKVARDTLKYHKDICEHIKHIFEEGELDATSVVRNFRTTGADGKN